MALSGFDLSVGDVLTGFDTAGNSRTYSFGINISRVTGVPEPGSLALLSLGLFGIVLGARNKRQ